MDEEQRYEGFHLDNDFEGGQFIGDEFFFTKQKRKRQQTKEEAIYGYETDSDEEDGGRKGPRRKADYTKPVGFISSGVTGGTADAHDEPEEGGRAAGLGFSKSATAGLGSATAGLGSTAGLGAPAEDDEDNDILPGAFGRRILEKARERDKLQKEKSKTEKQRSIAKAANKDVGGFEKHTKGIGEKLLRMAGWKPGEGLGRNQQGIAAPIEAKLRPKGMGMGFNDYDEHKLIPEAEEKLKAPAKVKETVKQGHLWKKKHASERIRREYRTAEEVLKDAGEQAIEAPRQTIIDMRGPQARLVTNMEHLNVETTDGADEAIPMPELQHNLRLLVDLAEADIQRLDGKLRQEKDTAVILGREQQRMEEEVEIAQQQVEAIAAILEELERCQSGASVSTLPEKEAVYQRLKARYPEEYVLYHLADAALAQVLPHFVEIFAGWQPLQEPERGVGDLLAWRDLLEDPAQRDAIFQDVGAEGDAYARLLSAVVIPKVASAAVNEWEPRDCEPMLQWVEGWSHLLPPVLLRHVLQNLVFPKLRRAVDGWEPRAERTPLHAWLHPWLSLLGDQLQDLYPGIRYKLVTALEHWDPEDGSALLLLKPWSSVFEAKEWDALMGRSILPKLAWALDNRLTVNPACQDLAAWNSVVAWAPVMSPHMFAGLLESRFFPKWHGVLHYWLSNMPDFDEVTAWFRGWKSIIPEELQDHERIRPQLNAALDMINTASTGQIPQQYIPRPSQGVYGTGAAYGGVPVANGGGGELSLRQLVEKYAVEHNIEFVPKVGRMYNGLQFVFLHGSPTPPLVVALLGAHGLVYAFGVVSVVVDSASDMVKAQLGERWAPVSLQTLVEEHQRRVSSRGR